MYIPRQLSKRIFTKIISLFVAMAFLSTTIIPPSYAQSVLNLPVPGTMVPLSPAFAPVILKGIKIYPENPLRFDFIIDTGKSGLKDEALKEESGKLIKYFLAALTVPDDDLWVNLSPYEKDRIITDKFGVTEMGRDLLAQDYLLKQLTATLIYPENDLGKRFWDRVYKKAQEIYGTTEIPVNTFNKVWVVPERALVYENGNVAYIMESHLKVMLEQDYQATSQSALGGRGISTTSMSDSEFSSDIIREIIIPEIEREVNEGQNFTALRQAYQSLILATWFKQNLRSSILNNYIDQNKITGVDIEDKDQKQKIYGQYLESYKKGVFSYIKDDVDSMTEETIPRKYFSGGTNLGRKAMDRAMTVVRDKSRISAFLRKLAGPVLMVSASLTPIQSGAAMAGYTSPPAAVAFEEGGMVTFQDPVNQDKPLNPKLVEFYRQRHPTVGSTPREKTLEELTVDERELLIKEYTARFPDADSYIMHILKKFTPASITRILSTATTKSNFKAINNRPDIINTLSYLENGTSTFSALQIQQLFSDFTGVPYNLEELLKHINNDTLSGYFKISTKEYADPFQFFSEIITSLTNKAPFGFYRDIMAGMSYFGRSSSYLHDSVITNIFVALSELPNDTIQNDRHRILAVGYLLRLSYTGWLHPPKRSINHELGSITDTKFGSWQEVIGLLINDVEYGKMLLELYSMMDSGFLYLENSNENYRTAIENLSKEQILEFLKLARQNNRISEPIHLLIEDMPYETKLDILRWSSENFIGKRFRMSGIKNASQIVSEQNPTYWIDNAHKVRTLIILADFFNSDITRLSIEDAKTRLAMMGGVEKILNTIRDEDHEKIDYLLNINNKINYLRLTPGNGLNNWTLQQIEKIHDYLGKSNTHYTRGNIIISSLPADFIVEIIIALTEAKKVIKTDTTTPWKAVYELMQGLDPEIWSNDQIKKGQAMLRIAELATGTDISGEQLKFLIKITSGDFTLGLKRYLADELTADQLKNAKEVISNPFIPAFSSGGYSQEDILKIHEATRVDKPSNYKQWNIENFWVPMIKAKAPVEFLLTCTSIFKNKSIHLKDSITQEQAQQAAAAYMDLDQTIFTNDEHRQNSILFLLDLYKEPAGENPRKREIINILQRSGFLETIIKNTENFANDNRISTLIYEIISWDKNKFKAFTDMPQDLKDLFFEFFAKTKSGELVSYQLSGLVSAKDVPADFKMAYIRIKMKETDPKFNFRDLSDGYKKYLEFEDLVTQLSRGAQDLAFAFFVDTTWQNSLRMELAIKLSGGIEDILKRIESNPGITQAVLRVFEILPNVGHFSPLDDWTLDQFMIVHGIFKNLEKKNKNTDLGERTYEHYGRYANALLASELSFTFQTAVMRYFVKHGLPNHTMKQEYVQLMGKKIIDEFPSSVWRSEEHMVEAFIFLENIAHSNYSRDLMEKVFNILGGTKNVLAAVGTTDSLVEDYKFIIDLLLNGEGYTLGLKNWTITEYRKFKPKYEQFRINTGAQTFADVIFMMKLLEEAGIIGRIQAGSISNFVDFVNDRDALAAKLTSDQIRGIFRLIGSPLLMNYFAPILDARQAELETWADEILSASPISLTEINVPLYLLQRVRISPELRNQYLRKLFDASARIKNPREQFQILYILRMFIESLPEYDVTRLQEAGLGDILTASHALIPEKVRPPYESMIVNNTFNITLSIRDYQKETFEALARGGGFEIGTEQVSLEFTAEKFKDSKTTPEALIAAIKKGNNSIDLDSDSPIKALNNLLLREDLHTIMEQNRSRDSRELIKRIEELGPWELKRLNKLLIEENYPAETPNIPEKWFLTAKKKINGVEVTIYMHPNANRDDYPVFESMKDPNTGMVVYLGHSGQDGELLQTSLDAAPLDVSRDEQAEKLVLLLSCSGAKHYLADLLSIYPAANLIGPSRIITLDEALLFLFKLIEKSTQGTLNYQELQESISGSHSKAWVFPHIVENVLDVNDDSTADVNESYFLSPKLVLPSDAEIQPGKRLEATFDADFRMTNLRSFKAQDLFARLKGAAIEDPIIEPFAESIQLDPMTAENKYFKRTSDGYSGIFFIHETEENGEKTYFLSLNVAWRNVPTPVLLTLAQIELRRYLRSKDAVDSTRFVDQIKDLQVIARTLTLYGAEQWFAPVTDRTHPQLKEQEISITIADLLKTFKPPSEQERIKGLQRLIRIMNKVNPDDPAADADLSEEYLRENGLISNAPVEKNEPQANPNDKAMNGENLGGIDFNPSKLDLQTLGQGVGFQVPANIQNLPNLPMDGFSPNIIQIVPANLPMFLGMTDPEEEKNDQLSIQEISKIEAR